MNDQSTRSDLLAAVHAALRSCLEQLTHEEPDWANIHLKIAESQRALAVAEHIASKESPMDSQMAEMMEDIEIIPETEIIAPSADTPRPTAPIQESNALVGGTPPASGTSLAEKLSEQPLVALQNALSINDRVRFSALLTDGDVPEFIRLCEAVERCSDFEQAQRLLLESTTDVDWEDEDLGGEAFLTLVRRLFLAA